MTSKSKPNEVQVDIHDEPNTAQRITGGMLNRNDHVEMAVGTNSNEQLQQLQTFNL